MATAEEAEAAEAATPAPFGGTAAADKTARVKAAGIAAVQRAAAEAEAAEEAADAARELAGGDGGGDGEGARGSCSRTSAARDASRTSRGPTL